MAEPNPQLSGWALVLGASSGFGAATARYLATCGMDVVGVHFDRRNTQHLADEVRQDIEAQGRQARFFNTNAGSPAARTKVLDAITDDVQGNEPKVRVLLHSIAFGTTVPYVGSDDTPGVTPKQMDMTLDLMAHTLVYWSQDLVERGLMSQGSRIYAMTSAGTSTIWPSYGPVGAAKAGLEQHIRQLAVELAPQGISANAIRAGVTDTPALRKIPGNDAMIDQARRMNPARRITTTDDVARAIAALTVADAAWITGNVIGVDGGENLVM